MIQIYRIRIEITSQQHGADLLVDFSHRFPGFPHKWKYYPNVNGPHAHLLEIMISADQGNQLLQSVLAWPVMIKLQGSFIKVGVTDFQFVLRMFTVCQAQKCNTSSLELQQILASKGFVNGAIFTQNAQQIPNSSNAQLVFTINDPRILNNPAHLNVIKNINYNGSRFIEIPV